MKKDVYNSEVEDFSIESIQKFAEIKNLATSEARKIAFGKLSNFEKSSFWRYHISEAMKDFGVQQNTLLKEIYTQIKPSVYDSIGNDRSNIY
ncbi:hypothetical protein DU508_22925 [Pedobacter chinensis]|uniref:Uncharacterized protein n=1 Tax=Pedobacter chinensis TaxID=2282421 RepID=A0A369PT95_9SPHI|nr:hypothetical protein [Pedobacter chinensis]RDC54187.1 hypothetical protein DU508_22925 [Pedobacter chinensis]